MDTVWITGREAARRLGISSQNMPRIAEANRIRIRDIAGMKPKYHAEDIAALLESCVRTDGRRRGLGAVG